MTRTEIINRLIQERGYRSYLEIGVENPDANFNLINIELKEGVDPYAQSMYLTDEQREKYAQLVTYRMESDEFFHKINKKYDIIFIDGDHAEAQCDRDIHNALKHLNPGGCVVVHDVLPETEEMQYPKNPGTGPWTGEVWKSVYKLILQHLYSISVIDCDYGVAIIEAPGIDHPVRNFEGMTYKEHFSKVNMGATYQIPKTRGKMVSYFTPLFETKYDWLVRAYKSLTAQTYNCWEWILIDDTPCGCQDIADFMDRFGRHDKRVKYYEMLPVSGGCIGEAKYRASMLCTGELVAELDHDDFLMPATTEYIIRASVDFPDCGFFYTDCIECDENYNTEPYLYPEGFALGYGSYRLEKLLNPVDGIIYPWHVSNQPGINPATIRHIVGVPNHVRCWRRSTLFAIGGYNRELDIADDFELIIRTFLSTKMCHIPYAGYVQVRHDRNSQDVLRAKIQDLVRAIANHYHVEIDRRFDELGVKDWVFDRQPDSADRVWELSDGSITECVNETFDVR